MALALYRIGALWNTMVTVARARTLLQLYRLYQPEFSSVFVQALRVDAPSRARWLAAAYETLEPVDFSRDLVSVARGLSTAVWPSAMGWSDLGTPERLAEWEAGVDPGERDRDAEPRARRPADALSSPGKAALRSNPRGSVRLSARSIA
jgi:mannose-1-phosphate guanylyltransferase